MAAESNCESRESNKLYLQRTQGGAGSWQQKLPQAMAKLLEADGIPEATFKACVCIVCAKIQSPLRAVVNSLLKDHAPHAADILERICFSMWDLYNSKCAVYTDLKDSYEAMKKGHADLMSTHATLMGAHEAMKKEHGSKSDMLNSLAAHVLGERTEWRKTEAGLRAEIAEEKVIHDAQIKYLNEEIFRLKSSLSDARAAEVCAAEGASETRAIKRLKSQAKNLKEQIAQLKESAEESARAESRAKQQHAQAQSYTSHLMDSVEIHIRDKGHASARIRQADERISQLETQLERRAEEQMNYEFLLEKQKNQLGAQDEIINDLRRTVQGLSSEKKATDALIFILNEEIMGLHGPGVPPEVLADMQRQRDEKYQSLMLSEGC